MRADSTKQAEQTTIESFKEGTVLQDWAIHVKYPKNLNEKRPVVNTGLFKSPA